MQHDIAIDHSSGSGFSMWPSQSPEPLPLRLKAAPRGGGGSDFFVGPLNHARCHHPDSQVY